MNAQYDEAKLTAYALGELDETDRVDIERLLDESPDARAEVESIRRVAGMLEQELSAEPKAALNATHRQNIEATLLARKMRKWMPTAMAASILLALVGVSASIYSPSRVGDVQPPTPIVAHPNAASSETAQASGDAKPGVQLPASKGVAETRAKLAKVLPEVTFDAVPLESVLTQISALTGVSISANWNALHTRGVERESEVALRMQNVTGEKVLDSILGPTGSAGADDLAFAFVDGGILVSMFDDFASRSQPLCMRPQDHINLANYLIENSRIDAACEQLALVLQADPENEQAAWKLETISDVGQFRRVQSSSPPHIPVHSSMNEVKSKLTTPVPSLHFDATPLEEVFDDLSSLAGVKLTPNWPVLEAVAIEKDSVVSLNVRNLTVEKALQLVLDDVGAGETQLAYATDSQQVLISTLEDMSRQQLDWQGGEYQVAMALGLNATSQPIGGGGGGGEQGLFGGGAEAESADENTYFAYDTGAGADSASRERWAAVRQNNTPPKQFIAPSSTTSTTVYSPQDMSISVPTFRGRQISLGQVGDGTSAQGGLGGGHGPQEDENVASIEEIERSKMLCVQAPKNPTSKFARPGSAATNPQDGLGGSQERQKDKNGQWVYMDVYDNPQGTRDSERLRSLYASARHNPTFNFAQPTAAIEQDKKESANPWWNRPREGHQPYGENTGEAYARIFDNPFLPALQNPLSTFSIDVDTASYSNIRRMLTAGQLPPADAVRIEEMINYFSYDYARPTGEHPFSVNLETASCPWNNQHRLVRVGLKGVEIEPAKRPVCNLVFLIDVSGSMDCPNKLPLVKQAMSMLVGQLSPEDRVAMVVYAGASGLALPSTPAGQREKILDALDHLSAGGSTNGGEGIQLAYQIAEQNRTEGGVNRVILATDGDFNVGITDRSDLTKLITDEAKSGVFLSVLGFGMGNLKDATLEQLADKGNGNYAYIDTFAEAKKVLVDQIGGTLITIAKDVKIQIEFNPTQVAQYRLIGYENRMLAAQDFNDDKKDAGEIGAGHTVTALYEIVPATATLVGVDTLKYQQPAKEQGSAPEMPASKETMTVKLRYKQPNGQTSQLLEVPLTDNGQTFDAASPDLRFAASVAGFGMLLRCSPNKGDLTYDAAISMAVASMGRDPNGQRSEFIDLVRKAKTISGH